MEIWFWLVILFTLIYEPIFGYFDFQKFKHKVKERTNVRSKYYMKILLGLWIPTIFILLLVLFTELSFEDIGLTIPKINTEMLGSIVTYTIFALALFYVIGILYYVIGYRFSERIRNKLSEAKQKELESAGFSEILPTNEEEKQLWNYVSLTAGITEEIIYRGFMIYALQYLFPGLSIWFIILLAALLFGLAHTYQGFVAGVLKTTVVGGIFSMLYIGLGSILPLIVFHFLIDYLAKLGEPNVSHS